MTVEVSPELDSTRVRDPLLGARLGDYEVVGPVGEGGMGVVYEGLHTVINKRVAIKVIKSEFAGDQVLVRRVLAEAQAVNAVRHRGIVDIHAHGLTPDGRPYLVMELLHGETLFDLVQRQEGKALPRDEAIKLLLEATGPLVAAHKAGIVHRDLKPTNLFLCQEDDGERFLKLLDFGLAKRSVPGTTSSTMTSAALIVGTPDYMAPEQARAQPTDSRTDIYSLGVVAYELLAGTLPYKAPTPVDLVLKHLTAPVPRLIDFDPSMPLELSDLIAQMMAKDPAERPQSLEPVRALLKQFVGQPDINVARATPAYVPRPSAPKVEKTVVGPAPSDASDARTVQHLPDVSDVTARALPRLPEGRITGRRQLRTPAPLPEHTDEVRVDATARLEPLEDSVRPLRSSSTPVVIGALIGLIVLGLVIVFWGGGKDETTPIPVVEKQPLVERPPVEQPVEKPVVEKPVEKPLVIETQPVKPPTVEKPVVRPALKKVPTVAELNARIESLQRAAVGHPNTALPKMLEKYRSSLAKDASELNRGETAKKLDAFQQTLNEH